MLLCFIPALYVEKPYPSYNCLLFYMTNLWPQLEILGQLSVLY